MKECNHPKEIALLGHRYCFDCGAEWISQFGNWKQIKRGWKE